MPEKSADEQRALNMYIGSLVAAGLDNGEIWTALGDDATVKRLGYRPKPANLIAALRGFMTETPPCVDCPGFYLSTHI